MRDDWQQLDARLAEGLEYSDAQQAEWLEAQPLELRAPLRVLLRLAREDATAQMLEEPPRLESTDDDSLDDAAMLDTARTVGPYQLLRRLGEGGMGSVWLARRSDGKPDRSVALKLPRLAVNDPYTKAYFARERDMLAALMHPAIAGFYDAGIDTLGQPYLAMEYVNGESIDTYCRAQQLDLHARLDLFVTVAEAVAYAHRRLIVHRDIKPANVLVNVDGEVKLVDFGIARSIQPEYADSTLTRLWGNHAITPDYASPEQLQGLPVTVATDVYSLGVLLYALLTGNKPYALASVPITGLANALVHVRIDQPSDVTNSAEDARLMRGDLDNIIMKALKYDPEERYDSVQALLDDIHRHRKGYPIRARPDSFVYTASKYIYRNRAWLLSSATVIVTLLVGVLATLWQAQQAQHAQQRAENIQHFMGDMIRSINPVANGSVNPPVHALLEHGLKRLDASTQLDVLSAIQTKILLQDSLRRIRNTTELRGQIAQTFDHAKRTLGEDHPVTLAAEATLYSAFSLPGALMDTRPDVLSLPERIRNTPDVDKEYLISALFAKNHLHHQDWQFDEAYHTSLELNGLAEAYLGENHPRTIYSLLMMSRAYRFNNEYEQALVVAKEAAKRAKRSEGDAISAPLKVDIEHMLGETLAVNGFSQEAVITLVHAVSASQSLYGKDSPITIEIQTTLARVKDRAGELKEAASVYEAIQTYYDYQSQNQAGQIINLSNLVRSYVGLRDHFHAQPHLKAWLDQLEHTEVDIPYHGQRNAALVAAALMHAWSGEVGNAKLVLAQIDEHQPVLRHGSMLDPAYPQALIFRLEGEAEKAVGLLRIMLASMRREADGERNIMHIRTELGLALIDKGDFKDARAQLQQALVEYQHFHHHITPRWADALQGMHRLACLEGDDKAALQHATTLQDYWQDYQEALTPEQVADGMADRVEKMLAQVQGCDAQVAH